MKTWDIVGYSFRAEIYCSDCMRRIAIRQARRLGSGMVWGDAGTAEQALGEWASLAGIGRMDQSSFNTSEFPKVIFADSVESPEERCGGCFDALIPGDEIGYHRRAVLEEAGIEVPDAH